MQALSGYLPLASPDVQPLLSDIGDGLRKGLQIITLQGPASATAELFVEPLSKVIEVLFPFNLPSFRKEVPQAGVLKRNMVLPVIRERPNLRGSDSHGAF